MIRESYSSREVILLIFLGHHFKQRSLTCNATEHCRYELKTGSTFLVFFFTLHWIPDRSKVIWLLSQSLLMWLERCLIIFWAIWIGIFISFPYATFWCFVFKSPTVRQESEFHSSEQHMNTKTFGHLLLCFYWSCFSTYVQPGFHLFYISLTFFLNNQKLLSVPLKLTTLGTGVAQVYINQT